jgi:mannosyltransferase
MAPALSACTALAVSLLGISGASFWIDEAATISAAERPLPDLLRYLEWQDAVHAVYYVIMHYVVEVLGQGELAMRLPTALATAAAAAMVAVLGRYCGGPLIGMLAGLFYATGVTVTQYAQEARPYAFTGLAAVAASYAFARTIEGRALRWPILYALSMVLLGLFNVFALLLIPAHATTLFLMRSSPGLRGAAVRWLCATSAAGVALGPFVLFAVSQRAQVEWLPPVNDDALRNVAAFLAGDHQLILIVAVIVGLGAMAPRLPNAAAPLRELAVPWVVLPVVVLVAVSLIEPIFHTRYLAFSLPGVALLAGMGLAWLAEQGTRFLVAALVPLAVLTLPEQVELREQDSKSDDLRAIAQVLRTHARSGDGLLYLDQVSRWDAAAYPEAYRGLVDVTMRETPVQAANLTGTHLTAAEDLADRLRRTPRVWVIDRDLVNSPPDEVRVRRVALDTTGPYARRGEWHYKAGTIRLLVRTDSAVRPD